MNKQTGIGEKRSREKIIIITAIIAVLIVVAIVVAILSKKGYRLIKVNSFSGDVKIERMKKNQASDNMDAFEGMSLVPEDIVKVNSGAFLELLADDDKHIGAEENTGFVIHATGNEKAGNITIELLYGKALFTIDRKLNENSSFKVTTPNATLSVRGTKFTVAYDAGTGLTTVEVFEGTVLSEYQNEEKLLEPGDKLIVNEGGEVSATEERIMQLIRTYNTSNVGDFKDASVLLDVQTPTFKEENKSGFYNPSPLAIKNEDDMSLKAEWFENELFRQNRDEIDTYYENNKSEALTIYQNGGEPEAVDVTDWFPDTIELSGTTGNHAYRYIYTVTRVEMVLAKNYSPINGLDGEPNPIPNGSYAEGGNYVTVDSVNFFVYGYEN